MANKTIRLNQAARTLNVGYARLASFLQEKGHEVDSSPNARITSQQFSLLEKAFADSKAEMDAAQEIDIGGSRGSANSGNVVIEPKSSSSADSKEPAQEKELIIRDNNKLGTSSEKPSAKKENTSGDDKKKGEEKEIEYASTTRTKGLKVVGKLELDAKGNPIRKPSKPKAEEPAKPKEEAKSVAKQQEPEEPKKEVKPAKKETEATKQPEAKVEAPVEKAKKEEPKEVAPESKKQEKPEETKKPQGDNASSELPKEEKPESKEVVVSPKAKQEQTPAEKANPKKAQTATSSEHKDSPAEATKSAEESTKEEKTDTVSEKEATTKVENSKEQGAQKETPATSKQKKEALKKEEPKPSQIEEKGNAAEEDEDELIKGKAGKLKGLKVIGKIELPTKGSKRGGKSAAERDKDKKKKRKRVKKTKGSPIMEGKPSSNDHQKSSANSNNKRGGRRNKGKKEEASKQEVDQQLKKTLSEMSSRGGGKNKGRYKREKRQAAEEQREKELLREQKEATLLRVAEFISTAELATLMEVDVNQIIMKSMNLGMFISINQRLDAEAITILADEFDFTVEFTSAEEEVDVVLEEEDKEEDLKTRAPIVTIMGHVDHGKTSLLDYIRSANVVSGEAGGITQHIGAYDVNTSSGRRIVFLDTPGHEAFTAMRARGAKVTDVVIIVIAADDSVMPQTVEAINHAQVAGVPYIIAFNKVDKPTANVNKIKQELANMNILVDDWGGKIQTQEISAKTGQGIDDLLELVLLESDILELKANPDKNATGTVIEASLDKGRGYVATILVEAGTLAVGDVILAGSHYGRVKAMNDHRGQRLKKVGPATPVQVLGLNGAPQAGDKFNAMDSDREAKDIATKRGQILREQSIRATKRTTLSDLGRRIALGNFHQLNVILKGDVDGSIEALSDSLQKLSTEEIEVNIIHKAVGPIAESDVLLATASDAIVIGFQVRPVPSAKRLAENESVEIRLYSVIYDAINDVKDAMEGLLSPEIEEVITGNVEVRDIFKISKVGTVAGCYVTDGYMKRNSKIRVIRDGIVIYGGEKGGEINALKRFKDDVAEVKQGFECGLSIKNYNDLKVGDVVEAFEERETKRKLA